MKIDCQYFERTRDRGAGKCLLGWYGGTVYAGNCKACLGNKTNTPEAYAAAQEKYERTHPEPFRGTLKGCCGSAPNESA